MSRKRFRGILKDRSGSILIVCFFVLMMLTMFTLTVGYTLRQKFQVLTRLDARQKLRLVGDAGVQAAIYRVLHFQNRPAAYDALNQAWSRNEAAFKDVKVGEGSFSVFYDADPSEEPETPQTEVKIYGLVDEERKINLNLMTSPEVLQRLFTEAAALSVGEAKALVAAIQDWKDGDDDASSVGAEGRYYHELTPAYSPRNAKFETLAELRWVKGMTPEIYEKVRPYLTLDSSGQVNLNTASKKVLLALGFSQDLCAQILAYRNGRDRLEGTSDDQAFEELSSVVQELANEGRLDNNDRAQLRSVLELGMLTVKSSFFTAQVLAQLKYQSQMLQIKAIFDKRGTPKRWEELFVVS